MLTITTVFNECVKLLFLFYEHLLNKSVACRPVSAQYLNHLSHCTGSVIDVLRVLELSEDMEGVSIEAGLCTQRNDTGETDMAYRIDKKIQLSAPTKQLFPGMHPLYLHNLSSILAHEGFKV